jgi:phosphoribosylamine--glycine ligase
LHPPPDVRGYYAVKVLAVGGGAREHAIVQALKRDGAVIYACMKNRNPGIARLSEEFALMSETDVEGVVKYANLRGVGLAVIGPETPLEAGLADALRKAGIPTVGPSRSAARLETSKEFMRNLMEKHRLPGAVKFLASSSIAEINDWLDANGENVVVKPSGLTGGKGAKIYGEHLHSMAEVKQYCSEIIGGKTDSSKIVVLEEKLEGEEFTIQTFCDGRTIVPTPAVQDHKRAYEGDTGPNTGGMGSYTDSDHLLPFITQGDYDSALDIVRKVNGALKSDGLDYRGIIYGQFMLTKSGPKVVEFNARLGDPEAMNVLTIIGDSFLDAAVGIANGALSPRCNFSCDATVCKYVVPEGYGTKPLSGQRIDVDEDRIRRAGASLYYAAVNETEDGIFTTNSRSIGIVGTGDSISEAEKICESAVSFVKGRVFVRHDIGKAELIKKRVDHMNRLRGAARA